MKIPSILLAVLVTLVISAQEHRHESPRTGQEIRTEQSIVQEMTDPFGNLVLEVVDFNIPRLPEAPYNDPDNPRFVPQVDELEKDPNAVHKAVTVVDVWVVADEEFRAAHSNWQTLANQIVETADNALYRDFQLNLVVAGYYSWTSTGSSASQLLANLASAGSGLPNGLCVGFSADSNYDAGNIAYIYPSDPGIGFILMKDQSTSTSICLLRKNIGSAYGLSNDYGSTMCIMNAAFLCSVDYFDATHATQFQGNLGWYQ